MKMWWISVICILSLSAVSCDPVVKIIKGEIKGQILKSRSGQDFYSFTGIPYAKPPLDDLRFKPPQPVDPWDGILDATKEANFCTQNNYYFSELKDVIHGQEDCLYLNVYSPNLNGKLPVMFWIHGGGYVSGHGGSSLYGPDYLMDKDIVYVSINYRLGLFGFLSTEDDVIPGNYGMKDQVLALRWVQENIGKFGGDPGQVTIFGQSVGGASTGYHMLSPLSKGLFHKAILHSGTPVGRYASVTPGLVRKRSEAVAIIAGCHADTSEEILNCLKKLPATYLVELHNKFNEWIIHPSVIFPPVVESCDSTQEAFLCNHPIINIQQESIVPSLIGLTSGEGGLFVATLFNDTSLTYPEMNTDFYRILPILLMYKHTTLSEYSDEISHRIMRKYFPSGKIDDQAHLNAVDMVGDSYFLMGAIDMAMKISSPSHFYLFDYQSEFTFNDVFGKCGRSLGVSHGDDLISLFPFKALFPKGLNGKDVEVSKLMVDIWVKFASSKEPTIDGTDNGPVWPTFTSVEESSILLIDSAEPKIVKNSFQEKYTFWNELPIFSRYDKFIRLKMSNTKTEL